VKESAIWTNRQHQGWSKLHVTLQATLWRSHHQKPNQQQKCQVKDRDWGFKVALNCCLPTLCVWSWSWKPSSYVQQRYNLRRSVIIYRCRHQPLLVQQLPATMRFISRQRKKPVQFKECFSTYLYIANGFQCFEGYCITMLTLCKTECNRMETHENYWHLK